MDDAFNDLDACQCSQCASQDVKGREGMSYEQAEELLSYIELERAPGCAEIRCIGNGEYVVVLKNPFTYLWDFTDWFKIRQSLESRTKKDKISA